MHDSADYVKKEIDSSGEEVTIPGLKVADDVTACSFTIPSLQKGIHQITKFCKNWGSKCNPKKKKKVVVFNKGKSLKRRKSGT